MNRRQRAASLRVRQTAWDIYVQRRAARSRRMVIGLGALAILAVTLAALL